MSPTSRISFFAILIAVIAIGTLFWNRSPGLQSQPPQEEEDPELAEYMSSLHHYSQKLILAVVSENEELADFYLHEMEELSEEIEREVPEYEGHPIAELTRTMLMPAVEQLEQRLDSGDWGAVSTGLDQLVQSCNTCHEATDHDFIRITTEPVQSFNQDFRPVE